MLLWINLPNSCYVLQIKNQIIVCCPIIINWMLGKNINDIMIYLKQKKATIAKICEN